MKEGETLSCNCSNNIHDSVHLSTDEVSGLKGVILKITRKPNPENILNN